MQLLQQDDFANANNNDDRGAFEKAWQRSLEVGKKFRPANVPMGSAAKNIGQMTDDYDGKGFNVNRADSKDSKLTQSTRTPSPHEDRSYVGSPKGGMSGANSPLPVGAVCSFAGRGFTSISTVDTLDQIEPPSRPRSAQSKESTIGRNSERLLLTENLAPWPTSFTPLRSPKLGLTEYKPKIRPIVAEYFRGGDYSEFLSQVWECRSDLYNDLLVSTVFRQGLDLCGPNAAADHPGSWQQLILRLMQDSFVTPSEALRGLYGHIVSVDDLEKDVPFATEKIIEFLDMAVAGEMMPAEILYRLPENMLMRGKPLIAGELKMYKAVCRKAVEQFLNNKDYNRFEMTVRDVNMPLFAHDLVKRLILSCFDHTKPTRRLAVMCIDKLLKAGLIHEEDIQKGVSLALGRLEEVRIDVPHIENFAVEVLTEMITSELLTAELVKKQQILEYGLDLGVSVVTQVMWNSPEYCRAVWNGGGDQKALQAEMDLAIQEFFDAYDCEEVARIVGELHLSRPSEIDFIRRVILFSIERKEMDAGLHLLSYLYDVYWSYSQVEDAIESLRIDEDDLAIDIPGIREELTECVAKGQQRGLISLDYARIDRQYSV